ncbi:MAG: Gfo/Idh/MocA family oxidoreductase [Bacteroidota bacterium]
MSGEKMKIIHTALASYGMSGQVFHGPLLRVASGFRVTHILERNRNNSAIDFPEAVIVRNFENILTDATVDLVIVNTPDHLHFKMCRAALEAGKHVVVEKPFTQHSADAHFLTELARKKGRVLTVFQNRRWDSDFLTVRKVMESGYLGRIVSYEAHFDRYRNAIQQSWKEDPATGTGTLYNLGSHLIDQALQLFGKPGAVSADIRKLRDGAGVDDSFDLLLRYEGVKVRLSAGYLLMLPGPKFQLHGTEGSFLKWGADPQEDALKKGILPGNADWGVEAAEDAGQLRSTLTDLSRFPTERGNYPFFYSSLYEAICNGRSVPVQPQEATLVISVIEAAFRSNRERREILI